VAGQLGRGSCRTFADALAFLRTCPPDNDPLEFIFGDLAKEFTADEEKVPCALTYFSLPAKGEYLDEIAALRKHPLRSPGAPSPTALLSLKANGSRSRMRRESLRRSRRRRLYRARRLGVTRRSSGNIVATASAFQTGV
jgi:hypothetical protein